MILTIELDTRRMGGWQIQHLLIIAGQAPNAEAIFNVTEQAMLITCYDKKIFDLFMRVIDSYK